MADEVYLCSRITAIIVDSYVRGNLKNSNRSDTMLTNREREILQILAEGKNTKQIALALHISTKTVDTHRRHIMRKLDLHSLPELTKYAIRRGLSSLE